MNIEKKLHYTLKTVKQKIIWLTLLFTCKWPIIKNHCKEIAPQSHQSIYVLDNLMCPKFEYDDNNVCINRIVSNFSGLGFFSKP